MQKRSRQTRETLKTAILKYKEKIASSNLARSTKRSYISALNTMLTTCPLVSMYIKDITAEILEHYLNVHLRSLSNSKGMIYSTKTRKNFASILSKLFKWYLKQDKIRRSPFEIGVDIEQCDDKQHIMPYTSEEVGRVLEQADGSGVVEAFELICDEGTRVEETLGLTDSSLEHDSESNVRRLFINKALCLDEIKKPKTNSSKRTIAILEDTYKTIEQIKLTQDRNKYQYVAESRDGKKKLVEEKFIFCNPKTGLPWKNSNQYYYALKPYFNKAGVTFRGSQPARHTFATDMLQQSSIGGSIDETSFVKTIAELAEIMGHSKPEILKENYVHWSNYTRGNSTVRKRKSHRSRSLKC